MGAGESTQGLHPMDDGGRGGRPGPPRDFLSSRNIPSSLRASAYPISPLHEPMEQWVPGSSSPKATTPSRSPKHGTPCGNFLQPFKRKRLVDDGLPTTLDIRHQELEQLRANRPCLSDRQLAIVVDTWAVIQSDISRLGLELFTRLFETYPDVKGAFGPFKNLSSEDTRYSQELRAHGKRVFHTVEMLVDLRHDPDKAVRALHELGRKHIIFNAKVEYLDILGQQFLFAIEPVLKNHWNPEVEEAWAMLFKFMAHCMREAMLL